MKLLLNMLDEDHKLRNTPLRELKVEIRNYNSPTWRTITAEWNIGNNTYNELATFWKDCNEIQAESIV